MSQNTSEIDKAILEARKKFGDMLGNTTKIGGKGNKFRSYYRNSKKEETSCTSISCRC